MNRFYAPGRCPDCDALTSPQAARCPSCGLLLTGKVADELRASLQYADQILDVLRRVSAAEPVAVPAPSAPDAAAPTATPGPAATAQPSAASKPRRGLPAVSVPVVLLGLGTICVLVAAIVFVAVTWTDLSLGWRTTILLAITALATAAAAWTLRKGLRGAAEALTLVASGLLLIDLLAGNSAGLAVLSALDGTAFGWLVALVMAVSGLGWALWAQRTATRSLVGQQVVAALASIEMTRLAALGWDYDREWLAAIVAVTSAALGVGLWRIRVSTLAVGEGVLALLAWAYLATAGVVRAVDADGAGELFVDLEGAPLLAASALAAVVAVLRRPRPSVRTAAAALAVAGPVLLALLPVRDLDVSTATTVVAAWALGLVIAGFATPRPWSAALQLVGAVTALFPASTLVVGAGLACSRVFGASEAAWTRAVTEPLAPLPVAAPDAVWFYIPVGSLVVATFAAAVLRRRRETAVAASAGLAAGVVVAVLLTSWPLLVVGLVVSLIGLVGVAVFVRSGSRAWLAAGAVPIVLALGAALSSVLATGLFFALHGVVVVLVATLVREGARAVLVAVGVGLAAVSLEAFAELAGLTAPSSGLLLMAFAAVTVLAGQALLRVVDGGVAWRQGLEGVAVLMAVVAVAETIPDDVALTSALTISGAVTILVSFLSADRRRAAWAGSVLLVLASWVRLNALDVDVIEAYTLPGAAALLVAGLVWIRRTPQATSWQALGAPLALGLGPSLAVALDEPTSVRALLVGVAGVALVLAGVAVRWGAPLLVGGAAVASLAVVNIAPYAEALPRWILFGTAGVALLALGVTWEHRRQNLLAVHRYAARLR